MVGANDFSQGIPPHQYSANIRQEIADLNTATNGRVLHILVQSFERFDASVADAPYAWSQYGDALRSIAESARDDVFFVDLSRDFAAAGVPGDDPFDLIATDDIHPNPAGADMIAQLLLRELTDR